MIPCYLNTFLSTLPTAVRGISSTISTIFGTLYAALFSRQYAIISSLSFCWSFFFASDVVKAIGRGFDAREALRLLKDDYSFYLISLKEVAKTDKAKKRLKGRIIGEKGKMKTEIEKAADAKLCIYGSTVGIIAKIDTMEYAKEAVNMLINGAKHTSVLNYLSKARRTIMQERLTG